MVVSYKCPNCAANLLFDPDARKMVCGFCGSRLNPYDVASEEATEGFCIGEEWQETETYCCDSCGAQVIAGELTSATFCVYCGSPAMIKERLSGGVKPVRIIPFTYGKEEAKKAFLTWCSSKRLMPGKFTSQTNVEKLTGMYVPFWLFDYAVDVDVKVSTLTSEKDSDNSSSISRLERRKHGFLLWEKVPVDGSKHIEDELMELLEPYNYDQLQLFEMKYLAGFFAEKFDVTQNELKAKVEARIKRYVHDAVTESLETGLFPLKSTDVSHYYPPVAEYVLLPVWFLNFKYLGRMYSFAMNGQTGQIAGDIPTSLWKVLLIGLGLSAVLCPLFYFIGGLLI